MTADLARLLQGTLLTRDFLIDGIKGQDEYAAITDTELKATREKLSEILLRFPAARSPGESQDRGRLHLAGPERTRLGKFPPSAKPLREGPRGRA